MNDPSIHLNEPVHIFFTDLVRGMERKNLEGGLPGRPGFREVTVRVGSTDRTGFLTTMGHAKRLITDLPPEKKGYLIVYRAPAVATVDFTPAT